MDTFGYSAAVGRRAFLRTTIALGASMAALAVSGCAGVASYDSLETYVDDSGMVGWLHGLGFDDHVLEGYVPSLLCDGLYPYEGDDASARALVSMRIAGDEPCEPIDSAYGEMQLEAVSMSSATTGRAVPPPGVSPLSFAWAPSGVYVAMPSRDVYMVDAESMRWHVGSPGGGWGMGGPLDEYWMREYVGQLLDDPGMFGRLASFDPVDVSQAGPQGETIEDGEYHYDLYVRCDDGNVYAYHTDSRDGEVAGMIGRLRRAFPDSLGNNLHDEHEGMTLLEVMRQIDERTDAIIGLTGLDYGDFALAASDRLLRACEASPEPAETARWLLDNDDGGWLVLYSRYASGTDVHLSERLCMLKHFREWHWRGDYLVDEPSEGASVMVAKARMSIVLPSGMQGGRLPDGVPTELSAIVDVPYGFAVFEESEMLGEGESRSASHAVLGDDEVSGFSDAVTPVAVDSRCVDDGDAWESLDEGMSGASDADMCTCVVHVNAFFDDGSVVSRSMRCRPFGRLDIGDGGRERASLVRDAMLAFGRTPPCDTVADMFGWPNGLAE